MFPASLYTPPLFPGPLYPGGGKAATAVVVPGATLAVFPPSIFPRSIFPSSLFPDAAPAPLASFNPARDWDVYDDIIARLKATRAFADVYASDAPEQRGRGADRSAVAVVVPGTGDESEGRDDPYESQYDRKVGWTLEITYRGNADDPRARDRHAERLASIARNALNYQSLAGITLPAFTYLVRDRPLPSSSPSRTISLAGEFVYFVDGPRGHATNA